MLDDLLPIFGGDRRRQPVTLALRLPSDWRSYSADDAGGKDFFDIRNLEGSVVFIGPRFRDVKLKARSGTISLLLDGRWNFSDAEAAKSAAEVYDAYARMIGPLPENRSMFALTKFPQGESPGQWEAETRGRTVTIASSDVPFKDRSTSGMHEHLRHEILHLWFPNAVNLTGQYAWFYEGAALYQSLKLGVALKRIKFSDFLDTMSRAISIDGGMTYSKDWRREFGSNHYARAMVIAFLLDLQILVETEGRTGAEAGLQDILRLRKDPAGPVRAEEEILNRYGLRTLFFSSVFGRGGFRLQDELSGAGMIATTTGRAVQLSVSKTPSGTQKAILRRLGYN